MGLDKAIIKLIARFSSRPAPPPLINPHLRNFIALFFFSSVPVLRPKSRYLVETSVVLRLSLDTCFCALKYYFAEALVTNPKLLEKLLLFSQCKMVFTIVKIVLNLTILKDWFGCKYNTNNLLELYNDFLTCEENMELTYYSAGFDPVCFYCGGEKSLRDSINQESRIIIFKLQMISIQSVTCVCLVKNICPKKGAAWQERKG